MSVIQIAKTKAIPLRWSISSREMISCTADIDFALWANLHLHRPATLRQIHLEVLSLTLNLQFNVLKEIGNDSIAADFA